MKLHKSKLILIQCSALVVALGTVFTSVYAWYTANRKTEMLISNISTESGINCSLYEYKNNTISGYKYDTSNQTLLTDLNSVLYNHTNFINCDSISAPQYFVPSRRAAFGLEIKSDFSYVSTIEVELNTLIAQNSTFNTTDITGFTPSQENPSLAINIAEAINIYGYSVTFGQSAELGSTSKVNKFNFNYACNNDGFIKGETGANNKVTYNTSIDIANDTVNPGNHKNDTNPNLVFVIVIEFDNSKLYTYSPDGNDLYSHSNTGVSNNFMSLGFTLTQLTVKRTN